MHFLQVVTVSQFMQWAVAIARWIRWAWLSWVAELQILGWVDAGRLGFILLGEIWMGL
jgi:hypothetical protein